MEQLSKYLENTNFIQWVFEPNADLELWWNQFETENPAEKRNILLARKILLKLRTKDRVLTEEEKILLFSRILKGVEERRQSGKTRRLFLGLLKYAAVALLFFSIGALLFYRPNSPATQQFSQNFAIPADDNAARLIRANGENILLKEEKSTLRYQAGGELVVNHDTIRATPLEPLAASAMNQLIIPYGKTSEIILPDGTKVCLNAGSRLIYPEHFTGKTREVLLAGEAYFEVTHDQKHPFIVQVSDLRVNVLGTKFNISAYPSDLTIETVLAEGKVSVERNNAGIFEKKTELLPDQMASFDKNASIFEVKRVNSANYTVWTKGILQFERTDLLRITNRLERYYNIRFEFREAELGNLLISGKMGLEEDKDEICDRLALAASVKIVKKGEGIYEILK